MSTIMDSMTKYAAIDIGSNAVRLLLAMVSEEEFGLRVKKNLLDSYAHPPG